MAKNLEDQREMHMMSDCGHSIDVPKFSQQAKKGKQTYTYFFAVQMNNWDVVLIQGVKRLIALLLYIHLLVSKGYLFLSPLDHIFRRLTQATLRVREQLNQTRRHGGESKASEWCRKSVTWQINTLTVYYYSARPSVIPSKSSELICSM